MEPVSRLSRSAAGAIVVASFATTTVYLRHAWSLFPVTPDYQSRVEYRISDWLAKNRAKARVMATGSVRFWLDAWHDLAQLGGGSDQGLTNPLVTNTQWGCTLDPAAEPGILDAMPGRGRCLRVRPWFARALQRFP
jgi:hypothetical protein